MMITIFIFFCMIFLWIRWRKRKLSLFQRYGIPGPKPNFLLGNLIEFNKGRDKCIEEWLKKYGIIFGFYLGTKPYLVCADVEFLKLCQMRDTNNFLKKDFILSDGGISHDLYANMLPFQSGKIYKDLRSVLSTCFSTGKIKMMSTLMSPPIKIFLEKVEQQKSREFNIVELCKKLIFDVNCRSAFGVTTNVQNNENNTFIKSINSIFEKDTSDILSTISICFMELEGICTFLRHKIDSLKYLMNLPSLTVVFENCQNIINSRRKLHQHSKDLLQAMIDAEDATVTGMKKLPDDFVIANAMFFMAVGYDTTSTALSWCIYYLTRNPDIQEKISEEIKSNVSDNMEIQYSDLRNFPLLDEFILETLRFWQFSLLLINRVCLEDYHYKGMTIPKGCIITVPLANLQTDPEYWKEPHKFDPDRFSASNRSSIDSITYQPFGAGPRYCIGERLAKTTLKLVLANLLRTFKLEASEDKEMEVEYGLLLNHPKNGVIIRAILLTS